MFLDDELFLMCESAKINSGEDIQKLYANLGDKCQAYYQKQITLETTAKEAKVILDRTFNIWESFVRMLSKSDKKTLQILGVLFKKYSFKKEFMNTPELAEVYSKLK
jgi:arginyl-tRNA synthetase